MIQLFFYEKKVKLVMFVIFSLNRKFISVVKVEITKHIERLNKIKYIK